MRRLPASALAYTAINILAVRHRLEMIGVNARRDTTQVVHVEIVRNINALKAFIDPSVSWMPRAIRPHIAVAVGQCSAPEPTA